MSTVVAVSVMATSEGEGGRFLVNARSEEVTTAAIIIALFGLLLTLGVKFASAFMSVAAKAVSAVYVRGHGLAVFTVVAVVAAMRIATVPIGSIWFVVIAAAVIDAIVVIVRMNSSVIHELFAIATTAAVTTTSTVLYVPAFR